MLRRLAVLLIAALTVVALAGVAIAGDVVVDAVYAAQYSFPFFIALVYAHGTQPLMDVQLLVNGETPVIEDRVQQYVLDPSRNLTLFVVKKYATHVVQAGDTLTAVVTDNEGDAGEKTVSCRLLWYHTVVCKP